MSGHNLEGRSINIYMDEAPVTVNNVLPAGPGLKKVLPERQVYVDGAND